MASTQSIHGYYDDRLAEMDQDILYSMNLEAYRDYVTRTIPGTIIIFFLLNIANAISHDIIENQLPQYIIIILSFVSIVFHFVCIKSIQHQSPDRIKKWEIYFSMLAISTAVYWAVFSGIGFVQYGMDNITMVYLLFSVGIASGAAASNFIWHKLAQAYLLIILVPPIVILLIVQKSAIDWAISASVTIYYLFLYFQVRRSNSEYWKALINTKQLEIQAIELENANRAKSKFLSTMSHELRTPLTAIIGFGELIEMLAKDDIKKFASKIIQAGDHLSSLVNDILDLSAIESGKLSLSIEDVSLKDALTESISLMTPQAEKDDIQIISPSAQHIGCSVQADYMRLKQVLLNLLSNAIKYNRAGGTITVSCKSLSNDRIRVTVTDTGAGMSEAQLQQLFQEFNRVGAEQTNIKGTGIGLVITKRLVELMGGVIDVESEKGKGTSFWFELKQIKNAELTSLEQNKIMHNLATSDVKTTTSEKILYIEDNPNNLLLVTQLIEQYSPHKIISAPDGRLGIDLAITQQPALILLDINLPYDDGYTILKKLRKNDMTSAIPVIAVTANAMKSDKEKAKEAGFNDYITKPINFNIFLNAINSSLNKVKN